VSAGRRVTVAPVASVSPAADLLVRLALPRPRASHEPIGVALRDEAGHDRAPDAFGGDARNLVDVWYACTERLASLTLIAERFRLPETQFALVGGGVSALALAVLEKPTLAVDLVLLDALVGRRNVTVLDRRVAVRTVDVPEGLSHVELRHLPPADLSAVPRVGPHTFQQGVPL
jgi:hypothetical protein